MQVFSHQPVKRFLSLYYFTCFLGKNQVIWEHLFPYCEYRSGNSGKPNMTRLTKSLTRKLNIQRAGF